MALAYGFISVHTKTFKTFIKSSRYKNINRTFKKNSRAVPSPSIFPRNVDTHPVPDLKNNRSL